jgi:hypothetical protein
MLAEIIPSLTEEDLVVGALASVSSMLFFTLLLLLVQLCMYRYKSMLAEIIPSLTEEDLVVGALAANDDLTRVLHEYDALAKAVAGGPPAAAAGAAAAVAGEAGCCMSRQD